MTRTSTRTAGALAVVAGICLAASVSMFSGGPPVSFGGVVSTWFGDHVFDVQASAMLGFLSMVAIGAFGIAFREAMWPVVADRVWTVVAVVQATAVFGVIAMIAAGMVWSMADQAYAGTLDAAQAATLWSLARTLFRFAAWGLVVPVLFTAPALRRHSAVGQFAAVVGVVVAVGLLAPLPRDLGLYGMAAWLVISGVALGLPVRAPVLEPVAAVTH